MALILPADAPSAAQGPAPALPGRQRVPLLRATRQFCDLIWPIESQTQTPVPFETYYTIFSQQEAQPAPGSADEPTPLPSSIIIAPTPDAQYPVEYTGVIRPAPLSASNTTNFLSTYLPDLYVSAAMIYACGAYLRNFGAASDNPQQAMSWKNLYDLQKTGAAVESARQKSLAAAATPFPLTPLAGASRSRPAGPAMPAPGGA